MIVDLENSDSPEAHQFIREITKMVREADAEFEVSGGGTRHWVRDHFLPVLQANGYEIREVDKR